MFCEQVRDYLKKMGLAQPLTIFLRQEIDRMQRVIELVRLTLEDLKLAIDGTIIMSENLRDALDCMYDARIAGTWRRVSDLVTGRTRVYLLEGYATGSSLNAILGASRLSSCYEDRGWHVTG